MIPDTIIIKPIRPDEWLPDRCLHGSEAFDPAGNEPAAGCPNINYGKQHSRQSLEQLYQSAISKYGGCGFIAWGKEKVIAYHNFFPAKIAQQIRFYGCGDDAPAPPGTLVHHCLTIVKGDYRRKGICRHLVTESIKWAMSDNWKRFEVHSVLPDCEKGWQSDQKSCISFWKQFGFQVFSEYDADKETELFYGVKKRYSLYLPLDNIHLSL